MLKVTRLLRGVRSIYLKKDVFNSSKSWVRHSSITTWNKDWMPGPYPRTKEEKIAAAKKYNMLPEDYEPYPEEEGFGDYPNFPATHMETRDDFEAYDFDVYKRNYGEPLHPDFDICIEDKVNFQAKHPLKLWQMFWIVVAVVTAYSCLIIYDESHPVDLRQIPKQRPHRGEKSYTFEAAD